MGNCCQSEQQPIEEKKEPINEKTERILLEETDFTSLKRFSFEGQTHWAKVTRVIDGDTCEIVFFVRGEARKDSLRLFGFDSPEKKPRKASPLCHLEKEAALVVTDILAKLLSRTNNIVLVTFHKQEKYGRQMGDLSLHLPTHTIQIDKWLLEHKLVKPYFGKTKQAWTAEELHTIVKSKNDLLILCEKL